MMGNRNEMGDLLKTKRQDMNLSLKEVENATSIRMNYLRAIEEGEFAQLISPVYAQGFVKQYAVFLGLDGERLVSDNGHMFPKDASQEFSYGIGTLEMRGNHGAGVKWLPNAAWVGVSIFVVLLAWYFAKFLEVI